MNKFRTISRVLVVTAVVVVSAARADLMDILNLQTQNRLSLNKFTTILALIEAQTCKKHEHAKKALIDTIGHALDRITRNSCDLQAIGIHGLVNYGIRQGTAYLHGQGIGVDALANRCDVLPEGMIRDVVNPIVKTAAEAAMHPEAIMYVVSSFVPKNPDKTNKQTI